MVSLDIRNFKYLSNKLADRFDVTNKRDHIRNCTAKRSVAKIKTYVDLNAWCLIIANAGRMSNRQKIFTVETTFY